MKRLLLFVCCQIALCLHSALPAGEIVQLYDAAGTNYNNVHHEPRISPDGEWVAFWDVVQHDEESSNKTGTLYLARADGTEAPNILNIASVPGEYFYFDVLFTADSQNLIYNTSNSTGTYILPVTGGTPVLLGPGTADSWNFRNLKLSPDGNWIIISTAGALFSNTLAGGPPINLKPYQEAGDVEFHDYAITADSSRVVFRAQGIASRNDGDIALFSVPIGGGEVTRLSPDMPAGRAVENFQISPDSQWVVYNSDQEIDDNHRLYSVPIAGGPSIKLDDPENTLGRSSPNDKYWISPNSQYVAFQAYLEVSGSYALTNIFSVPIEGGVPVQLNEPFPKGLNYSQGGFTNDSQYVAFGATGGGAYATPIGGEEMVALHPPVGSSDYIDQIRIFPNLSQVFFHTVSGKVCRNSTNGVQYKEIAFNVARLTRSGGYWPSYLSPDGRRFVYNGGPSEMSVMQSELGTGEVTPLFDPSQSYSSTTFFAVSESDNRIVIENDYDIYARALEYIESAALPTWVGYR